MDYARQDLDITKSEVDLLKNRPDSSKPFVTALDDLQKRNQKRRPLSHAALDGVIGAVKYNAQEKQLTQEQQIVATLEQNLADLRSFTSQLKRERAEKEALLPYASAAIKLSHSNADPETINNNARTLFEMAADKGLVKGRFVSMAPNSSIAVIQGSDGKLQAFDLSSLAPEEAKLAQEERMKKLSLGIQQQNADAYGRSVKSNVALHKAQIDQMPETLDVRQKEANNAERRLDYEAGKNIEKSFAEPIKATKSFIKDADRIDAIVTNNKGIFQSLSAIQWGNENPGYFETIRRDLQTKFDPATADSIGSLIKYINKMTIDITKGFKRPNMFIEKIGSKAVPNLNMSPDSFKKVLAEMKQDAEIDLKNYKRHVETFDTTNDKKYYNSYFPADENTAPQGGVPASTAPQGNDGRIKVQDPTTGAIKLINPKDIDIAISRGAVVLE